MPAQVLLSALQAAAVDNRGKANIALPEYARSLLTALSPDLADPPTESTAVAAPMPPSSGVVPSTRDLSRYRLHLHFCPSSYAFVTRNWKAQQCINVEMRR
jgi:hypothetical protein